MLQTTKRTTTKAETSSTQKCTYGSHFSFTFDDIDDFSMKFGCCEQILTWKEENFDIKTGRCFTYDITTDKTPTSSRPTTTRETTTHFTTQKCTEGKVFNL